MEEPPGSRALPHLNTPRAAKTSPLRAAGPPSGAATRQRAPAVAPLPPCPPPPGADLGASPPPARSPGRAEAPPHPGGRSPPGRSCGKRAARSAGNGTASLPLSLASTFPAAGGTSSHSRERGGEGKEVGPSGSQDARGRGAPPAPVRPSPPARPSPGVALAEGGFEQRRDVRALGLQIRRASLRHLLRPAAAAAAGAGARRAACWE